MTTNDSQHRRGGKSLLDLPGELRNAIYEHFIDLAKCPHTTNATTLLWVNRQIRAEFRSLYFRQGNVTVYFDGVASFLRAFILPSTTLVLDDVTFTIRVELGSENQDPNNWLFNLMDVISTMRKYPLLNIRWNLVPPGRFQPHNDLGFATHVSILKDMEDHEFEKVNSIIELRNAVYKYFIDLDPSLHESIQFLQVNRQIRSEFGSLYLSQGNAIVPLDCLIPFLRDTFQPIASQRPKDFTCSFLVQLDWNDLCWHRSFWDLDLFETVAFMRGYPLLDIEWDLNPFNRCSYSNHSNRPAHSGRGDRSDVPEEEEGTEEEDEDEDEPEVAQPEEARSDEAQPEESESEEADSEEANSEEEEIAIPRYSARVTFSVDDIDVDLPLSILRNLEDELYAKLAAIDLSLSVRPPLDERFSAGLVAYLDIALMANCTEQDFEKFGFGIECGGVKVRFHIAHEPDSEYNVSESEEDE
ncbi:uncharacterized protein J4E88_003473 [Alternaria novae-zelandiae]|uniref:uncharacterized protein n=1 Tax=Alternaria novae-zelandiae TaxID=430562 RepID=UPI0020C2EA1A|nr:uncharacterized protein J4E88_003473 [Alternaria novae-zelandiae]KAI4687880.1 hypothetical protein J4E88_003473 [Alternaria novae-zelandiae]